MVQLKNRDDSSAQLLIYALSVFSTTAQEIQIRRFDTDLASVSTAESNLLADGALSAAECRVGSSVAASGTLHGNLNVLANTTYSPPLLWLYELGPGDAIILQGSAANTRVAATFWYAMIAQ